VLTRKTLGGLQTDLSSCVLQGDGAPFARRLCGGRGRGLRRRARLPRARRHVPRRLHFSGRIAGRAAAAGG
jgi:predicted oxidoreductase